ncbi:hypothetical protein PVK06_049141 [Gossypium arboreum]|uniref:Uncharacterized protein n=1 Tax=Gossypium arboreum TaxID=29729 RepID=A0ABR0MHT7_GOSAR|nr:hypothetical protein PVK06_049141 [Gossypium arboreum]
MRTTRCKPTPRSGELRADSAKRQTARWHCEVARYELTLQSVRVWTAAETLVHEVVNADKEPPLLRAKPTIAQMRQHSEECAKKRKAITCLQNGVSDMIFTRIMFCETPKQA